MKFYRHLYGRGTSSVNFRDYEEPQKHCQSINVDVDVDVDVAIFWLVFNKSLSSLAVF